MGATVLVAVDRRRRRRKTDPEEKILRFGLVFGSHWEKVEQERERDKAIPNEIPCNHQSNSAWLLTWLLMCLVH